MQMFKRLLLIVALVFLVSGCAKRPVQDLENTRNSVSAAYAAGAAQYAPGEFQLANSALQAAELQVEKGRYREAVRTLELAQRYSTEALRLTREAKQRQAAEEKKRAEEKRLREQEKLKKLQQEAERRKQLEKKKEKKPKTKKPVVTVEKKKPTKKTKPKLLDKVEVRSGDDLAAIAARKDVYGDPLLWPLLYKANRDQIKDPKEIFVGQTLVIPRDKSRDEIEAARQEARDLGLFDLAE